MGSQTGFQSLYGINEYWSGAAACELQLGAQPFHCIHSKLQEEPPFEKGRTAGIRRALAGGCIIQLGSARAKY